MAVNVASVNPRLAGMSRFGPEPGPDQGPFAHRVLAGLQGDNAADAASLVRFVRRLEIPIENELGLKLSPATTLVKVR